MMLLAWAHLPVQPLALRVVGTLAPVLMAEAEPHTSLRAQAQSAEVGDVDLVELSKTKWALVIADCILLVLAEEHILLPAVQPVLECYAPEAS